MHQIQTNKQTTRLWEKKFLTSAPNKQNYHRKLAKPQPNMRPYAEISYA